MIIAAVMLRFECRTSADLWKNASCKSSFRANLQEPDGYSVRAVESQPSAVRDLQVAEEYCN